MKEAEFRKVVDELRVAIAAVDVVVFSMINGSIHVFLNPVHRPPHYIHTFGLPGGVILQDESADEAALRHLAEKAHIENVFLEQLYTFSDPKRDKRSRSISIAYIALLTPEALEKQTTGEGAWVPVGKLPPLAYDHEEMVRVALDRVKSKFIYTNVAKDLLPKKFTLPELQRLYEIVLGKVLDKRNFRKKLLSTGLIKEVGEIRKTSHRPAQLYTFTSRKLEVIPEVWAAL